MVEQNFLSPQVKRSVIISNKLVYNKLPQELPYDLKLKKLLGTRGCLIIKQLPIGLLFERVTPTVQSSRVLNIYLSN